MIEKKIESLIVKYCSGQLKSAEANQLNAWLELDKNKKLFQEYVALNFSIEELKQNNKYDKTVVWNLIQEQINSSKPKRYLWKYVAAAVIALLISLPFVLKNEQELPITEPIIVNNNIETGTDKAILTLEDGTDISLEKGQDYIAENIASNGEEIIYNPSESVKAEIAYNYLTIPRGGQYYLKLSDGTQVWLNSESKLKYPVSFIDGDTRKVELLYGEAYFDVSPSTNHKGSKFNVVTKDQEIEVLGTEFNIKAYSDEDFVYSTLVEGKVIVTTETTNTILAPNQQTVLNLQNKQIETQNVTDIYGITAWKKGVFSFKDMPLNKIMKVLSRWYDADVVFINKAIEGIEFTGILGKEQSIENIMSIIYDTNNIPYEINNKTIIFR